MDSRKILEIYKLINDRSIKPVSAWSTIADIPQGAVVLDTDGVVKQCVYVFNNAGADLVDCGVLPYLENIRENNLPITIECVFAQNKIGPLTSPVVWGGTTNETNMAIKVRGAATMWGTVGVDPVVGTTTIAANVFVRAKVARNVENMSLCYNGNAYERVFTNTLGFPSKSLLIGGQSNSGNIEGPIAKVRVYSGYSAACDVSGLVMLDEWDFNKWDGSASGLSNMGYPYSVTKASPFTELVKALVPVSML